MPSPRLSQAGGEPVSGAKDGTDSRAKITALKDLVRAQDRLLIAYRSATYHRMSALGDAVDKARERVAALEANEPSLVDAPPYRAGDSHGSNNSFGKI